MNKSKNFGAVNELQIESVKLQVIGAVSNDCQMVKFNSAPLEGEVSAIADEGGIRPAGLLRHCVPHNDGHWMAKRNGFTLAEVLITLVVIGVVAAITIPVLHSNTGGKEWNTAKQKARAGLGEAFKLMSINGELENYPNGGEDVVEKVLPKYLKLAKTCKGANAPTDCGFAKTLKTPEGNPVNSSDLLSWQTWFGNSIHISGDGTNSYDGPSPRPSPQSLSGNAWKAGFFQTLDGFSIALFYNPNCRADEADNSWGCSYEGNQCEAAFSAVCFNAVYDMNGNKGPNRVGDDIGFVGSLYSGVSARSAAVLPVPGGDYWNETIADFNAASASCRKLGSDYDLPTIDELSLIYLNRKVSGLDTSYWFWARSGMSNATRQGRVVVLLNGFRGWTDKIGRVPAGARCVRADKLM